MSKPNLLYYFPPQGRDPQAADDRDARHLAASRCATIDSDGDPVPEIRSYIRRKLEMSRDFPRESRLFANEMLQGAPRILDVLEGDLKALVDEKAQGASQAGWTRARSPAPTPTT